MFDNPVHYNIQGINRLDSSVRDILNDKDKELIENTLEKVYFKRKGDVWLECEAVKKIDVV